MNKIRTSKKSFKPAWFIWSVFAVVWPSLSLAQTALVVSAPHAGAPSPEGVYSTEPWSSRGPGPQSSRYQQVYSASEFSGLGTSPGSILRFGIDSDREFGRGTSLYLDLEILFGVTAKNPDGLSTTFAENVGSGMTMVHSRGVFLWGHPGGGAGGVFELETPYLYDPTQGNLLMEIRAYSVVNEDPRSTGFGNYEAWDVQGDAVSRVYAHDVNATTGIADSMGLTTHFVIIPVPEPSTFALLGLSLGGLCWWLRRQQPKGTHS